MKPMENTKSINIHHNAIQTYFSLHSSSYNRNKTKNYFFQFSVLLNPFISEKIFALILLFWFCSFFLFAAFSSHTNHSATSWHHSAIRPYRIVAVQSLQRSKRSIQHWLVSRRSCNAHQQFAAHWCTSGRHSGDTSSARQWCWHLFLCCYIAGWQWNSFITFKRYWAAVSPNQCEGNTFGCHRGSKGHKRLLDTRFWWQQSNIKVYCAEKRSLWTG